MSDATLCLQENIKETVEKIVSFITKYKSQRYIECEIRLGRINDTNFDSNISKKHYERIIKELSNLVDAQGQQIIPTNTTYTVEYDADERRKIDTTVIKKTRLDYMDFEIKNSPIDIRVSISKEQPVKNFGAPILTMQKKRQSFAYKNWIYDLTITDDTKYSIEIELDHKKITPSALPLFIYSTLMKVSDISLICEKDANPGEFILAASQN